MGLLRYLLALSVLFAHCGSNVLLPANYAVESFYIISGFYMTLILNEKYVGKNSYRNFILKRFFRLAPSYWAIAICTLILVLFYNVNTTEYPNTPIVFNPHNIINNTSICTWAYSIISNIFMLGQDIALFFAVNDSSGHLYCTVHSYQELHPFCRYFLVPQAWSIGLEILFYIIAPFVVRQKAKIVLTILTLSLFVKVFIKYVLRIDDGNWTFRFFPSEMMFFCIGALVYRFYKCYQTRVQVRNKGYLYIAITIFVIIYMKLKMPFCIQYPLLILFVAMFVFVLFSNFKYSRLDRIIGELSYPIYLSHSLIIMFLYLFKNSHFYDNPYIVGTITTLFSFCLYICVIKPFEKIRNRMH